MIEAVSVLDILVRGSDAAYSGERVTQLEHALQCAMFAEKSDASTALVVATLLHDIGHILAGGERPAEKGIDGRHEKSGADYLARWFGPDVTEPVRLHVAAKRYLCAVDKDYFGRLSPASVRSLELQGGPMQDDELASFETSPYARDALNLRQWDEQGKVIGLATPSLDHYRDLVETVATR